MRPATTLALCATTLVGSAAAFSNTHPVIAWTNHQLLSSLSVLSTPPTTRTPFRSTPSEQLPLNSESPSDSDLCSLSHLLLLSAPGLHISDLSFLPSTDSSPTGLRASLAHAKQHGAVIEQPYVPARLGGQAGRMVERFVQECGATLVEGEVESGIWKGAEERKTVRIIEVEGLEEWELVGKGARAGRKEVVARIDTALNPHLLSLARTNTPHAIILTSLPSTSLTTLKSALPRSPTKAKLAKRQYEGDYSYTSSSEEEATEEAELLEELEAVASDFGGAIDYDSEEATAAIGVSAWAPKANQTSIFAVKPNAGLLHRYVFFTPALIFGLLISLLLLIPVILIGSTALQSVETVQGLEGKMLGGVAVDQAKSG